MSSYSNSRLRSSPIAIHRPGDEDATKIIPLATTSSNNIKRREIDSDDEEEDFIMQAGGALSALQLDGDVSYVGSVPMKPRGMRRRAKPSTLSSSLPVAPMLSSRGGMGFDARLVSLFVFIVFLLGQGGEGRGWVGRKLHTTDPFIDCVDSIQT
jgi:hypothetical protein